jgi:hypothetical protein
LSVSSLYTGQVPPNQIFAPLSVSFMCTNQIAPNPTFIPMFISSSCTSRIPPNLTLTLPCLSPPRAWVGLLPT